MARAVVLVTLASSWLVACGNDFQASESGAGAAGGSGATGAGAGGKGSAGAATGGASTGGSDNGGGAASGGAASGGASSGGAGTSSGGAISGGTNGSGGSSMGGGGADAGGTANGGTACGNLGSACVNDCSEGLECNNGLCVPVARPPCGGFNPVECPNTHPHCLYCSGCDFGDCFTAAELACVCVAPNVSDVYDGCS